MRDAPTLSLKTASPGRLPRAAVSMKQVDCLVLGGGQGTRLFPLTQSRPKPAVPFGGECRLIDVAMCNAIRAGCRSIYVITQFLSSSLHQYIYKTYGHRMGEVENIEMLTAEQRPSGQMWYQGTADAVRQNLPYLLDSQAEYFLIISGDQLYNLDFSKLLHFAKERQADLVVASLPVTKANATRMGILAIDHEQKVCDFHEKPSDPALLARLAYSPSAKSDASKEPHYLGSMGIYLFSREALLRLLVLDPREDFGKHLIPTQASLGGCYTYLYDGYWEDIGTISSFYHANMALTQKSPPFSFCVEGHGIQTVRQHLAPARILQGRIDHSLFCDGVLFEGDEARESILGPRVIVRSDSIIRNTYIMGNDHYIDRENRTLEIGKGCHLQSAILDTNVSLGDNVKLINKDNLTQYDGDGVYIRDGIIVVSRGTRLPNGYCL